MSRTLLRRLLRWGFLLVALGFGIVGGRRAVADGRRRARAAVLARCSPGRSRPTLAALGAGMMMWRALLADLGSPLHVVDAAKVFFVGQLGKYIPGSLWPVLAQMELARDLGVPRPRSAAAFFLTYPVYLATGLLVAVATLPVLAGDSVARYAWLAALLPLLVAALHPRVVNAVLNLGLRLIRRPPLERPLSRRGWWPRRPGRSPAGPRTACTCALLVHGLGATGPAAAVLLARALSRSPGAWASSW